jgi:hypothetical protein
VVVRVFISPKLILPLGVLLLAASVDAYTCTNTTAPNITFIDSAVAYGGYSYFTSGSWLEIYGSNLADPNDPRIASGTGEWAQSDFNGANAPTNLDGISATVNGKPAFISYISPGQINVQSRSWKRALRRGCLRRRIIPPTGSSTWWRLLHPTRHMS